MASVEVWVLVDAEGNHAAGTSAEAAREAYEQDVQALVDCDGFRLVKVTLQVPLPVPVELTGKAAELGAPGSLFVE